MPLILICIPLYPLIDCLSVLKGFLWKQRCAELSASAAELKTRDAFPARAQAIGEPLLSVHDADGHDALMRADSINNAASVLHPVKASSAGNMDDQINLARYG
jgi:hypothetical protein